MLKLLSYNTLSHYDPGMDAEALCIIGYTGRGSYTIRAPKAPEGKKRRQQMDDMKAKLAVAIERGYPPGEVSIDTPLPEANDDTFDFERDSYPEPAPD